MSPRPMARIFAAAAAVAVADGAVPRDHNPTNDPLFQHGYWTPPAVWDALRVPSTTKAYDINGVDKSCTAIQLESFVRTGVVPAPAGTCDPTFYAHTRNNLHFHDLDFDSTDSVALALGNKLQFNNLGGQGPNNGCGCRGNGGPTTECPSYVEGGRPEAQYHSDAQKLLTPNIGREGLANSCPGSFADPTDPALIMIKRVTTVKCDGLNIPVRYGASLVALPSSVCAFDATNGFAPNTLDANAYVSLRIYSTSVYRPADFGVDENGFLLRGSAATGMFQINLRPVYNELAGPGAPPTACSPVVFDPVNCPNWNAYDQPFYTNQLLLVLQNSALLSVITQLLPDLGANLLDARYTNTLNLAFVFTLNDGTPYPLDEFYLSFFDFDQDYADGAYAFVRETLLVFEFTTVFMDTDTEVESRFIGPILSTNVILNNILTGGFPIRTMATTTTSPGAPGKKVPSTPGGAPWSGTSTGFDDIGTSVTTLNLPGAAFRSTREGTGSPHEVKYVRERCEGYCSNGLNRYVGATTSYSQCGGNRQTLPAAVGGPGSLYSSSCLGGTPCAPVLGGGSQLFQPLFQWTGCGFSDSGGFSVLATGNGPDNEPGGTDQFYARDASIACELDCPRLRALPSPEGNVFSAGVLIGRNPKQVPTTFDNCVLSDGSITPPLSAGDVLTASCDDAGNPTEIDNLSGQQRRRAVTFLFRETARVALQFRTEVGSSALANVNNAVFDTGDNNNFPKKFPDTSEYARTYQTPNSGFQDGIARLNARNAFLTQLYRLQTGNPSASVQPPNLNEQPVRFVSNGALIASSPLAMVEFGQVYCNPTGTNAPCTSSTSSAIEQPSQYNPNKARITLGTAQNPLGRNFLFGSRSSLVRACPPQCECYKYPGQGDTCPGRFDLIANNVCNSPSPHCTDPTGITCGTCPYGTDCTDCGVPPECPPECRPPASTPPPPPPPPPPTTTTCTACLDPHLTFAHGGKADFRGKDKTWYPMLSARNVTMNTFFKQDTFNNKNKVVHGSAMTAAAWVLRTNATGKIVTIEFNASADAKASAYVKVSDQPAGTWVNHGKGFDLENVKVDMRERKLSGATRKAFHGIALVVSTNLWTMSVWSRPYPNAAANPGKALLNIHIEALYDADKDVVAPHGLIGQSYDGDALPLDGEVDDYAGKEVTTKAMAEGALEGDAADYELRHKFATRFKYSRFDATVAKHRDVSKLGGKKGATPRSKEVSAVAAADLEEDAE